MTTKLKRVTRLRRLIKARLEKGEDEELKIFDNLSEDRFDEAIVVHTMQTELKTIDRTFGLLSRSRIPEKNSCIFTDVQLQYFSDLWFKQQKTATVNQKHMVGMAYITDFLGLGEEVAEAFLRGGGRAYYVIGHNRILIHNASLHLVRGNISAFWRKVKGIFPGVYSNEEITFLSRLSFQTVEFFIKQLEPTLAEDAQINRSLRSNETFFFPNREA